MSINNSSFNYDNFFKKHISTSSTSFTKIDKNSTITIRILVGPKLCIPVWLNDSFGKPKRLNSLSVDQSGNQTGINCPLLEKAQAQGTNKVAPSIALVYGIYNFATQQIEILIATQQSIWHGIAGLTRLVESKGKNIFAFNITISRTDAYGKTTYSVGFSPDHELLPQEAQTIEKALEPTNPDNVEALLDRATKWPTQEEVDKLGLGIKLPNVAST